MLCQNDIINFLNQRDYDLRKSNNGRWIDQKCAADVVSIVADCILEYNKEHLIEPFTTKEIWHNPSTVETVEGVFKKPGVEKKGAKNEYDKFFQQPMEMLAYSGVLKKVKHGTRNYYTIEAKDVLEYIALRERNALIFLQAYIEKVLKDSNIYYVFEKFFQNPTQGTYEDMKVRYEQFIIHNTKINGKKECDRIFIKVLNPLSYYKSTYGTEKGRISKFPITYDMLMYNRHNFRDIYANKPKGMTRKEYALTHPIEINNKYYEYLSRRAKRYLRNFNDEVRSGITEYLDGKNIDNNAIHMHHIFPEAEYPEISFYIENLIALTPTQHLSYAHPNGRTKEISETYQHLLLLAKTDRIKENLQSIDIDHIYDFRNFMYVLRIGFDNEEALDINYMDFSSVVHFINYHYSCSTSI